MKEYYKNTFQGRLNLEKERYASVRPTDELLTVFELVKRVDDAQDMDRQAIFDRAMRYVVGLTDKSVLKSIARKKFKCMKMGEIPASLKVRVNEDLYEKIVAIFREVFKIDRVKTPYLMRVTLMAYLTHIDQEMISFDESERNNIDILHPIRFKLEEWINYEINSPKCPYVGNEMVHDIYRALNDTDCKLTGGNLLADTIFSLWNPLKMVLDFLNSGETFYKNDKYGSDKNSYLRKIKNNLDKYLPVENELVKELCIFAKLSLQRENVMLLPDRKMQSRGKFFFDQMPKTLFECFGNGKYASYFQTEDVTSWIKREKLEMFFYDNKVDKDKIKPLIKRMKASEVEWLKDGEELREMIQSFNSILILRQTEFNE